MIDWRSTMFILSIAMRGGVRAVEEMISRMSLALREGERCLDFHFSTLRGICLN